MSVVKRASKSAVRRLNFSGPTPLYEQIRNHLLGEFRSSQKSDMQPIGDALLMRRFGVSRTTVRMAIAELVRQGVVKRIPGRGTFFIKEPRLEIGVDSLERMLHEWDSLGFDHDARVLSFRYVNAGEETAGKLKVAVGSKVLLVRRLRTKNNKPVCIDARYTADWCAHVILREDAAHLLLPVVESRLKIKAIVSEQEIWAQSADQTIAKVLKVKAGSAVLSREVTLIAEDGRPISTGTAHYRADLFRFRVHAPGDGHRLELQSESATSIQKRRERIRNLALEARGYGSK